MCLAHCASCIRCCLSERQGKGSVCVCLFAVDDGRVISSLGCDVRVSLSEAGVCKEGTAREETGSQQETPKLSS